MSNKKNKKGSTMSYQIGIRLNENYMESFFIALHMYRWIDPYKSESRENLSWIFRVDLISSETV